MPSETITEEVRRLPRSPEDRPLPAENCCELCLLNIPRGSLMIILPGLILLLTGIVVMSWTKSDSSWNADLSAASLIFLILGGFLFFGGVLWWICMWYKYKPKTTRPPRKGSISPQKTSVELVGVWRVENPDHSSMIMEVHEQPRNGSNNIYDNQIATIT